LGQGGWELGPGRRATRLAHCRRRWEVLLARWLPPPVLHPTPHPHAQPLTRAPPPSPTPQRTLLTTEECLLNPNRNPQLTQGEIEANLKRFTGATKVIWLPK
jgi:hypothetical protein